MLKLDQWLILLILVASFRWVQASEHAIILQYHHVSDKTPKVTSISPKQFSWHLDYLEQQKFTVWPLSQITQYLKQGKPLPDKCIAITFDDAYRSIYTTAFPLLKKRNWPFTLFLNTNAVGKGRNSLSWHEIREMNHSVAEIANHSSTHAHLIRYQKNESFKQWQERVTSDIQTAQKTIDQQLSNGKTMPPRLFAYPYGEYSLALTQIISQLGYSAVGQQSGPATFTTPQSMLPRFPMGGIYTSKSQLIEKLKTFPLPLIKMAIVEPQLKLATGQEYDRPILQLKFKPEHWNKNLTQQLQCYVSGQSKAVIRWDNQTAYIQAKKPLKAGRSRYNCTAPVTTTNNGKAQQGFYWYSQLWIKRKNNGQWYQE